MILRRQFSGAQAIHRSCVIHALPGRLAIQVRGWVGERRVAGEAAEESSRGRHASENAGMSSECRVRISAAG